MVCIGTEHTGVFTGSFLLSVSHFQSVSPRTVQRSIQSASKPPHGRIHINLFVAAATGLFRVADEFLQFQDLSNVDAHYGGRGGRRGPNGGYLKTGKPGEVVENRHSLVRSDHFCCLHHES